MTVNQSIADRIEIADLFARLVHLLDEGNHEDVDTIYTKDIAVHSPRGGELHGIEEVLDYLHRSQVKDENTQHINTDLLVHLNGDEATATANQLVHYYRTDQAPHQTSGLRVTYTASRTPAGWRFNKAQITLAWTAKS